jgi:hypothetical protein
MSEIFTKESLARLEAIRAKLDGEEAATLILQLIENVRYVNGCVARGNGSDLSENPLENVFEYIKQLEQENKRRTSDCLLYSKLPRVLPVMGLVLLVDIPEAKQDVHQIMNGSNANGVTNESKPSRRSKWNVSALSVEPSDMVTML